MASRELEGYLYCPVARIHRRWSPVNSTRNRTNGRKSSVVRGGCFEPIWRARMHSPMEKLVWIRFGGTCMRLFASTLKPVWLNRVSRADIQNVHHLTRCPRTQHRSSYDQARTSSTTIPPLGCITTLGPRCMLNAGCSPWSSRRGSEIY